MILDTNALSDFLSGVAEIRGHVESAGGLYVPSIALGEYRYGLRHSRIRDTAERKLEHLLREIEVLPIDAATSTSYADVRSELKAAGTPIPENDVWIAALVRQHQMPLLSRDAHFDYVRAITRLSW